MDDRVRRPVIRSFEDEWPRHHGAPLVGWVIGLDWAGWPTLLTRIVRQREGADARTPAIGTDGIASFGSSDIHRRGLR